MDIEEKNILAESDEATRILLELASEVMDRHRDKVLTMSIESGDAMPLMLARARLDGMRMLLKELRANIDKVLRS